MLISSVWRANSRWYFSIGLLVGGATSAVLAAAFGTLLVRPFLPEAAAMGVAAAFFGVAALHEFGLVRLRLPQNARQVPEAIENDGPISGALQFGFEMGTGVRTYMSSALPHALVISVFLTAGWTDAIAAGLCFGAGRALMTLSRTAGNEGERWDSALVSHERAIRIIMTVTMAGTLALIASRTF
ncbi:hypothetical protein OHR68_39480 [Spirillospora sp. NBC_00431]